MRIFRRCVVCGKWLPLCRLSARDFITLFAGIYIGTMMTVAAAWLWGRML